ncbi:FUSC family protein [Allobranchiibius huperziae]|uniref:Putative membrane protein YccC n=1 Tax=Allobranchiibius huperziae TaxID=1874116 RepID=A0A853DFY7_9MICO|nr:FUSC family protein [Allobranchiibius huperziae]NYJ73600.1 putative membrane protein YccC [Allobranchiibius huperziae]
MRRDTLRVPRPLMRGFRRAWPTFPSTWSEASRRVQPAAAQIGRLTGAAVLAYLGSTLLFTHVVDLTAPLTALLVVQASTVGTLRMAMVRVGAVLTGVLVATAFSNYFGLSWWSLAAVISASLVLAKMLRLGAQSLETPISAMLILAVSSPGLAAEIRIGNTLIGTVVGVAFSVLVPVAIPNTRARDAVRGVARSQAALLGQIARTLSSRAPGVEEAQSWIGSAEAIGRELAEAATAVEALEESRKLNPRALVALRIHPELRVALQRLDRCCAAERALAVLAERRAFASDGADGADAWDPNLRVVFSVLLDSLASGVHEFGDLVAADRVDEAEQALDRIREVVLETRARHTELVMIDPMTDTDSWMMQGSMLAAIDQIVRQLDLEHPEQATAAWNVRPGLEWAPRTWVQTGQRIVPPVARRPGRRRGAEDGVTTD